LIANPYALHNAQFVHCAIVKDDSIDAEFLELSTVLIVDKGEEDKTTNSADAYIPNKDLICTNDLPQRYVHKLIVIADNATTVF
jgi:hypothetical protein